MEKEECPIYKKLELFANYSKERYGIPAIGFVTPSKGEDILVGSYQLFTNADWNVAVGSRGTSLLTIPVTAVLSCLKARKDRIDDDLRRLNALKNKIHQVLGDVPIVKDLNEVITSISEGIDKYKYLKTEPIESELNDLIKAKK